MLKNLSLIIFLTLSQLAPVFGQQPDPTPSPQTQEPARRSAPDGEQYDVVRITTKLVQVDASVTDKSGKQVDNLSADDFVINENGKPQKITHFSYVRTDVRGLNSGTEDSSKRSQASKDQAIAGIVPVTPLRREQVNRAIALVVDDLRMSHEGISSTRQALRKYVDTQMAPGDLVAIIRTSTGIGSLQQFTNNREQLYRAIDNIRQIARVGMNLGAFTSVNMLDRLENQVSESTDANENSADRRKREGSISSAAQSSVRGVETDRSVGINEFRNTLLTVGTLGALNFVVRGLKELPGRKAVVLFSDGISIFNSDSNSGDRNERVLTALRQLVDQANRASVVFYAVDTRGLQPSGFQAADNTSGGAMAPGGSGPSGSVTGISSITPDLAGQQVFGSRSGEMFEGQNGLSYLTRETGGLAVFNNNDLDKGIRRALEDIGGYYLIGYRPDDSTFDPNTGRRQYNSLNVSLKNHPDLKVRSRTGFISVADENTRTGNGTKAEQLMAALMSPFAADGINLQLTTFFVNDAESGSTMRSVLLMDADKLTFTEQNGQMETNLDIAGVTLGEKGEIIDHVSRVEKIRVSRGTYERFQREGMAYGLNVPVAKPGAYMLRVAVRDAASGVIGAAGQYIEVPNVNSKDQLILSSLVISGNNPDGTARRETPADLLRKMLSKESPAAATSPSLDAASTSRVVAGGEGMVGTEDPRAGPASRRFKLKMYLNFACIIYKMKKSKAFQLTSQVRLYHDGREVFIGVPTPIDMTQQQDLTRLVVARRLFLGTVLEPGTYILHLTVTDGSSGRPRTATRWLDFSIIE